MFKSPRLSSRLTIAILVMLFALPRNGQAQVSCVLIQNLVDTITTCPYTTVQLNPSIAALGQLTTLDTTWTPATGLSNPDIINPIVTLGATSQTYTLEITALTPANSVANGNFSNGNTGFTSDYIVPAFPGTYGLLSNEATYAVTTNPSLVHNNFAGFLDHTGDADAEMMVVNGASSSNTSIWCQTIAVTPNTDYDFSAWGATAVASTPAILQFEINGVLIGSPLALPVTTGVWTQFHAVWNSGAATSITICINDQQTAPSGNDFAIDDIEFRQICHTKDSVYILVPDLQTAISKDVNLGCEDDTVVFSAINNGATTPGTYLWNFGQGLLDTSTAQNPTHVYTTQSTYTITLYTERYGCLDTATTTVNLVHPILAGFVVSEDTVCRNTSINFQNTSTVTGPPTYQWTFGDGPGFTNDVSPGHAYDTAGSFEVMLVVTDTLGCTDTATAMVEILPGGTGAFVANDTFICEGGSILFDAIVSPGWDTLRWDFGDGSQIDSQLSVVHSYDTSGVFAATLTLSYDICPTQVIVKPVTIVAFPRVDAGRDTAMCPGSQPMPLVATATPGASLLWSDTTMSWATVATAPGTYWVRASVAPGCEASDTVVVGKDCYLDIPNVFTPDGDGLNDYFLPRQLLSEGLGVYTMQVFNRWGQLIYETSGNGGRGWDGRMNDGQYQPQGVYVYRIAAVFKDGTKKEVVGNVTLLR